MLRRTVLVAAAALVASACHGGSPQVSPSPSASPRDTFDVRGILERTIPAPNCRGVQSGVLDQVLVRIYDPKGRLIGRALATSTGLTKTGGACLAEADFLVVLPHEDYYVARVPGQPPQRASPGDLAINGFQWELKA